METKRKENLKNNFIYFMMYSILGWIYEVFLEVVIYRWGFSNRGLLWGPYCPIYGVGAFVLLFTANRLIKDKIGADRLKMLIPVIVLSGLLATAVELAATYICEYTIGYWPWQTYSEYKFNYQARIALSPSIRFGLGGAAILYVFQPMLEKIVHCLDGSIRDKVFYVLFSAVVLDAGVYIINYISI